MKDFCSCFKMGQIKKRQALYCITYPIITIKYNNVHFFLTHYRNLFAFLRNLSQVDLSRACCPKFFTYINVRITTISSHFLTIYTNICHRTEVQIIILRYLTGLKLNWFKSYDTNEEFLLQRETEILTFCAITFEPIMAQTCSVGEKWLELVGKRPFLSSKF